jgi:ribosomal protein L14E/L6E/L27E
MAAFENGSICFRTKGKNAGEKVVVLEAAKKGMVVVEGTRSKKGKANIMHLWPTGKKAQLKSTFTKKELKAALEEAGV